MLDRTSCRGQDVFFDGLQKLESEMRRSLSATELKRRIDLAAGRELPELVDYLEERNRAERLTMQ